MIEEKQEKPVFRIKPVEYIQPDKSSAKEGKIAVFAGLTPDISIPFIPFPRFTLAIKTSDVVDESHSDSNKKNKIHVWKRGGIFYLTEKEILDGLNMIKSKGIRFFSKDSQYWFKLNRGYGNYRFSENEKPLGKCAYFITVDEILEDLKAKGREGANSILDWRTSYRVRTVIPRDEEEEDPWKNGFLPKIKKQKEKRMNYLPITKKVRIDKELGDD